MMLPLRVLSAFRDELEKRAGLASSAAQFIERHEDPLEIAGLGYLAAPNIDNMQAKFRARRAGVADAHGHIPEEEIEKRRFIKERFHDPMEAGGLAALALPNVSKMVLRKHGSLKVAALNPKEKATFERVRKENIDLQQALNNNTITDSQKVKARHNAKRFKELLEKRRNDAHKLPDWVHDFDAEPPPSKAPPRAPGGGGGGYAPRANVDPRVARVAGRIYAGMHGVGGAALGGLGGTIAQSVLSDDPDSEQASRV